MLTLKPITLRAANQWVNEKHRHHKACRGHKFSIAAERNGVMCGAVIAGRPVARRLDDGSTLEVNRLCTDGTENVCSLLYGAARRAAKAMGYRRIITYTLPHEGGASLRASGWRLVGLAGGGNWNKRGRQRADTPDHLQVQKHLWECAL